MTFCVFCRPEISFVLTKTQTHFSKTGQSVVGPLHLAKFAIANIGQILVQALTQYLVQVCH